MIEGQHFGTPNSETLSLKDQTLKSLKCTAVGTRVWIICKESLNQGFQLEWFQWWARSTTSICFAWSINWYDSTNVSFRDLDLDFGIRTRKKSSEFLDFRPSGSIWKVFDEAMMLPLLDSNNQPVRRASVAEALFTFEWAFKKESKEQDWSKAYGSRFCMFFSHTSTMHLKTRCSWKTSKKTRSRTAVLTGTEFWDQSGRELRNCASTDVCEWLQKSNLSKNPPFTIKTSTDNGLRTATLD